MKKMISTAIVSLFITSFAAAHEGHDHDAPAAVKAPKGGIIKSVEESHIEVVSKGKDIKIYFYDHDMKLQDPTAYKASATAELPRKKGKEVLKLEVKDGALESTYDAKGSHRYTLTIELTDPKGGHKDSIKYTIEPKR